jgi:hypothetical protein
VTSESSSLPGSRRALGPSAFVVLVLFVGIVLVAVLASFPDLVRGVRSNTDLIAPVGLGRATLDIGGDNGTALTGDHSWLIGLWAVTVLEWLDAPTRGIIALPGLLWIVTGLWILRFWWRRGRRFEAVVAFALVLTIGRALWTLVGSWNGHGGTAQLSMVAAVAAVAGLAETASVRRRVVLLAGAGFCAGLATGSDLLALFSAVVPLAAAIAAVAGTLPASRTRTAAAAAFSGLLAGVIGTKLVAAITDVRGAGHDLFLRSDPLGGLDALYRNASVIWSDSKVFTDPADGENAARLAAFAAGWLLVLLVGLLAVRTLRSRPTGGWEATRPAGAPDAARVGDDVSDPGVRAWTAFWATGFVLMPLAFVMTSVSSGSPDDYAISRYLVVWWVAIAALLPLVRSAAERWIRPVCLSVALVVVAYGGGSLLVDTASRGDDAPLYGESVPQNWRFTVQRAARQYGATHGYAGYFTSYGLGLGGDEIPVYPVMPCDLGDRAELCASRVASRPSMYRATRGRSFVVLDARAGGDPFRVEGIAGNRLRTVAYVALAPAVTMVVYDGDAGQYVRPAFGQAVQNRFAGR